MADVNLLTKDGLDYIEIVVNPWSFPVKYDGEHHYQTELKWDAATISNIGIDDLDNESFDIFRREALSSGRMSKEE